MYQIQSIMITGGTNLEEKKKLAKKILDIK